MRDPAVFVLRALLLVLAFFAAPLATAEGDGDEKPEATAKPEPEPAKFVSEHRLRSGGTDLSYVATAEDIILRDADGEPTATFFTLSYVKAGLDRPEDRPLTFVFNGGPGSSSIWLHFGLVGPKLIDLPSDASDPGGPPYRLKDNPRTILRATDLVFVDPVGTGYSKALGEKKNEDFWGYTQDADSVAEFIRTFVTVHNRWNSPKYILGESYGGIRTALLVPRLQQELNVGINGLILISPALNMGTLPFIVTGNDLPYATHLPAYAAAAHYHGKLPDKWPDLTTLLAEVEAFAGDEYLSSLFRGDALDPAEKRRVAERLHRYTGLDVDYILRSDLRTPSEAELAVAKAQLVGWLEGLVQGIQATLFAQQVAAQQQLASIRGGLPPGAPPQQQPGKPPDRPGQYL